MTHEEKVDRFVDEIYNNKVEIREVVDDYFEMAVKVQELEEHLRLANQYVKKERELNTKFNRQNKRYREAIEMAINIINSKEPMCIYNATIELNKALEGEEV